MTDPPDRPPEKREPLAALTTYEPVPSNKLFPAWERNLKFAWIGAVAVVAVVGYRYWKSQQPAPVVPIVHFQPATPWSSGGSLTLTPAISHDGKFAVYASDREGQGSLAIWIQPLGSGGKPTRVTAGEFNETDPDFSPDDRQIAFRSERDGGGIYVVPAAGGLPKLIAEEGWRPKFSPDGKWIAFCKLIGSDDSSSAFGAGQIFIVPAGGGDPKRIQPDFPFARYPIWTPDGKHLLFVGTQRDGSKDWWVTGLDGGEAVRTHALESLNRSVKMASYPEQWLEDRIFFSAAEETQAHVWDLPVSASTWQVSGPPRRLTNGAGMEQQSAVAPDGRVLFASVRLSVDVWSLELQPDQARVLGKLEPLTHDGGKAQLPSIAAEASKIMYVSDKSGVRDIWVMDSNGEAAEAVTSFRQIGYRPVISGDGNLVLFPASIDGKCTVLIQGAMAASQPRALKGCFGVWDWSPDRKSLLTFRSTSTMNIVELMRIASGEREPVLTHPKHSFYAVRFSPDGRWIAFAAGMSIGQSRVFVAPLRNSLVRETEWIPIGADSGGEPAWSPNGQVLYFRSKRDGYHCIWAQKLDSNKKPLDEPIAILHLHSAGLGVNFMKATDFNLAVGKDRLVLNLAKDTSTLWTMQLERKK